MEDNKEVETKVTRKRQQVVTKKKSIRFKKPDIKIPDFLKLTKKQVVYLIGVLCLIICSVCIANYDSLGLVLNKNITDKDVVQVDLITSNNKIYPYENEVLVCNSEGINSYNKYGKNTWTLELQGAIDDDINTSGKYLQIINKDKAVVYVYKDKYEVARIKIDGTILSGNINENGDSIIEYNSSGNKTILAIYNSEGKLKYNVKLSNNIIGMYILSNNSKYLAYVDVNIKGISVATNVMLVELDDKDESKIETLHTSENSLVYDMYFYKDNIVYKLDEEIICQNLNNRKKQISNIENESLISIDACYKKYAYVSFEDGKYLLGVRNIGGKVKENIPIREMPKHFIYNNGNIFVCYQKNMTIYNSFKIKIKEYNSSTVITEPVIFGNGRNVALLVSNKLIMFDI